MTTAHEPHAGPPLRRRWIRVWQDMDTAGLDTLIVYGTSALSQYGNISYLIGTLTGNLPGNKGVYCIIRSGLPPVLVTSSRMERRAVSPSIAREIETIEPIHPGRAAQLALVADLCRGRSPALAGPPHVPYADALALREHMNRELPVVDLLGEARRSLTAEDHRCMRVEAEGIEEALTSVIRNLSPGLTERDIAAAIEEQLIRRGSQVRIVHVCAGHFHGQAPGLDVIGDGDLLTVFVESAGETGHWVEIGLIAHIGAVTPSQQNHTRLIQTALCGYLSLLVSPRRVSDVAESGTAGLAAYGGRTISLGHGTGVDEQPWALATGTERRLLDGEAVAVHPSLEARANPAVAAAVANTFLVGPVRAEALSQLPFSTLVVPRL